MEIKSIWGEERDNATGCVRKAERSSCLCRGKLAPLPRIQEGRAERRVAGPPFGFKRAQRRQMGVVDGDTAT